jgi:hypothetical protein
MKRDLHREQTTCPVQCAILGTSKCWSEETGCMHCRPHVQHARCCTMVTASRQLSAIRASLRKHSRFCDAALHTLLAIESDHLQLYIWTHAWRINNLCTLSKHATAQGLLVAVCCHLTSDWTACVCLDVCHLHKRQRARR